MTRLLATVLLGLFLLVPARGDASPEYRAKAAFLYNFGKFVQWPDGALSEGELRLCVLGEDPFGDALDAIDGKQVRGSKLIIQRGASVVPKRCHILFVSSSEGARVAGILEEVDGANVLTVGETDDFAKKGGIVNFKIVERKIRFEINPDAAKQAGLRISARLLKLATVVATST